MHTLKEIYSPNPIKMRTCIKCGPSLQRGIQDNMFDIDFPSTVCVKGLGL